MVWTTSFQLWSKTEKCVTIHYLNVLSMQEIRVISFLSFLFFHRSTKTHPGPVVHLSDSPKDEGKVSRYKWKAICSPTSLLFLYFILSFFLSISFYLILLLIALISLSLPDFLPAAMKEVFFFSHCCFHAFFLCRTVFHIYTWKKRDVMDLQVMSFDFFRVKLQSNWQEKWQVEVAVKERSLRSILIFPMDFAASWSNQTWQSVKP